MLVTYLDPLGYPFSFEQVVSIMEVWVFHACIHSVIIHSWFERTSSRGIWGRSVQKGCLLIMVE